MLARALRNQSLRLLFVQGSLPEHPLVVGIPFSRICKEAGAGCPCSVLLCSKRCRGWGIWRELPPPPTPAHQVGWLRLQWGQEGTQ